MPRSKKYARRVLARIRARISLNDKEVDGGDIVLCATKDAIAEHRACTPMQGKPRPGELRPAFARHKAAAVPAISSANFKASKL